MLSGRPGKTISTFRIKIIPVSTIILESTRTFNINLRKQQTSVIRISLRPGGVLAAVLYSGKVIGDAEKQAALAFFKALPLTQYTVLVCEFANWAQTAPLPCFVIKK